MRLLCLSDLHLRSEAVVAAIDRQRLSPFLAQIAATVAEVSPDAVVMEHRFPCTGAPAFRNAYGAAVGKTARLTVEKREPDIQEARVNASTELRNLNWCGFRETARQRFLQNN